MKQAFYYMFKDTNVIKKTYIFFLFILASTLVSNFANVLQEFMPVLNSHWQDSMHDPIWNWVGILLAFVSLVLMFIPNGYVLSLIKSLSNQENEFTLPEMSLKCNFTKGLKVAVAFGFIYVLFVLVASLFLTASIIVALAFSNQIMFYITIALIALAVFVFLFYFPIFNFMFAYKSNLLTYFRYMMATKIFMLDKKQYLKGVALFMCLFFVAIMLVGFLSSTVVLKNPILFFISSILVSLLAYYFMLTEAFIVAKSIKLEALDIIGNKSQV